MNVWQIQQAKQRLSEVIRLAGSVGPQMITSRGEPVVWVISDKEYVELMSSQESIVDFFQRSPHRDIDDIDFIIERRKDGPRSVEL